MPTRHQPVVQLPITWEQPPPVNTANRRPRGIPWRYIAEVLHGNPGRWVRLLTQVTPAVVTTQGSRYRLETAQRGETFYLRAPEVPKPPLPTPPDKTAPVVEVVEVVTVPEPADTPVDSGQQASPTVPPAPIPNPPQTPLPPPVVEELPPPAEPPRHLDYDDPDYTPGYGHLEANR